MIMMVNVQGSRLAIDNNEYVVILITLKAGLTPIVDDQENIKMTITT